MAEKRSWNNRGQHDQGHRQHQHQNQHYQNKRAKTSQTRKDIFDVYTDGQKQLSKMEADHQSKLVSTPSNLDRTAMLVQLCFEIQNDASFFGELSEIAGEETATRVTALAKHINDHKTIRSSLAQRQPRQPHRAIDKQLPSTPQAWFERYPDTLPDLPRVLNPDLEKKAFTSPSATQNQSQSYERLEWLGDAYLEIITHEICYHIFPDATEGLLSQVTQDCVRNETLARFSLAYGFDERLKLPSKHMVNCQPNISAVMTKTYGDVFEAYLAAVIKSDTLNGYTAAFGWLNALLKPIILKYKNLVPINPKAKEELSRKVLSRGIKLEWEEVKPHEEVKGGNVYHYSVSVVGWAPGRQLVGTGSGTSKAHATNLAAMDALTNPATAILCSIKQKYDALVKTEREREGGPDPEAIAALDKKYKAIQVS